MHCFLMRLVEARNGQITGMQERFSVRSGCWVVVDARLQEGLQGGQLKQNYGHP